MKGKEKEKKVKSLGRVCLSHQGGGSLGRREREGERETKKEKKEGADMGFSSEEIILET